MVKKVVRDRSTQQLVRGAQRIMIVAAHPDDAELALGASIVEWRNAGIESYVVDLTNGEPTPFGSVRKRMKETLAATKILNLEGRRCLGFKNRELTDSLQARRSLASVIREIQPQIIFSHYWNDVHPDHVAACQITEGARFYAKLFNTGLSGAEFFVPKILYYPSIHVRLRAMPSIILDGSRGKDLKLEAIRAYRSQFQDNPKNTDVIRRVRINGEFWGDQINTTFGEPIYSREPIGISPNSLAVE